MVRGAGGAFLLFLDLSSSNNKSFNGAQVEDHVTYLKHKAHLYSKNKNTNKPFRLGFIGVFIFLFIVD